MHTLPDRPIIEAVGCKILTVCHAMPEHIFNLLYLNPEQARIILEAMNLSDHLIATEYRHRRYIRCLTDGKIPIHVIKLGIDVRRKWRKLDIPKGSVLSGDPRLLFVDTWNLLKHPMKVLFILPDILEVYKRAILHIMTPRGAEEGIDQLAKYLKIEGHVEKHKYVRGFLDDGITPLLARWYNDADAVISMNPFGDTNMIMKEAVACGVPLINISDIEPSSAINLILHAIEGEGRPASTVSVPDLMETAREFSSLYQGVSE